MARLASSLLSSLLSLVWHSARFVAGTTRARSLRSLHALRGARLDVDRGWNWIALWTQDEVCDLRIALDNDDNVFRATDDCHMAFLCNDEVHSFEDVSYSFIRLFIYLFIYLLGRALG